MAYRAVFHIDQNEEAVMNLALNNVMNLLKAIPEEEHDLVLLHNGPAVRLVTRGVVEVFHERIRKLKREGVRFQICKNAMERFEITQEQVIGECDIIPAGIVALIDLQNDGFSYIKP